MTKADGFEEVVLLCLGMVILKGNKKGVEYVPLDAHGKETTDTMCFAVNKLTRGSAGSVYYAESSENRIRNIRFAGLFEDTDRRAVIQLASRAIETEHQAYIQQKKAGLDDSAILEMLRPLRQAYHSTNVLGKSALVARVINIMQRSL